LANEALENQKKSQKLIIWQMFLVCYNQFA
jgi:hypothetical protein